jgi:oligopeptide transport system substrate-binding protein
MRTRTGFYTQFILLMLMATSFLLGCSGGESNVENGNRENILHIGNGAEPQGLDPHVMIGTPEANIAKTLFEGLVNMNPYTLEPEPGVAESWTYSADRRVMTFRLNPAARWTNGDTVTAEDFVWSWQRALNPKFGNLNASSFFPIKNAEGISKGEIKEVNTLGVKALDNHTLEITLNQPTPYFISALSLYYMLPVHRPTIEKFGKSTDRYTPWTRVENMVSNGPFTLKEWKLNRRITVEKNPTYWGAERVQLKQIVFHAIESIASEERMFRVGQLHCTVDVPLSKIASYKASAGGSYVQAPYLGIYYFMLNTTRAPVDDVRVRRALSLAIDRETLAKTVLQDVFLPAYSLTPPGIPEYQPPRIESFDPLKAQQLLREAGYPGGEGWPGIELTYNTAKSHQKVAIAIQQMWKETLNIDVTLQNMEWKVYLDALTEMDYEIGRAAWIGGFLDPVSFLEIFITDGGNNGTGFSNSEYDELVFREAGKAATPEKRMAIFNKAESLLLSEMPIIPLFSYTSKRLQHPSVQGMPPNILGSVNYRYVWLDSSKGLSTSKKTGS